MMARQMKASGVSWIGDIPSNWLTRRGQTLFNIRQGHPFDSALFKDTGTPVIRMSDFDGQECSRHYDDMSGVPKTARVEKNTILMGLSGSIKTTVWRSEAAYLNQRIAALDFKAVPFSLGIYFAHLMASEIEKTLAATTIKNVSSSQMRKFAFPVATPAEQIAIASYLDDRTTAIDSKIQLLEEKSKSLAELRKSVVHQAVTKGLNANVAMKPSGVDWIGDVPAHWQLRRNKDVFNKIKTRNAIELPAGSLSYGEVVYKDEKTLTAETKGTYQAVQKGHFLLNPINLNFDLVSLRIGLSAIDVCVSSAYLVFSNFTGDSQYLKYALRMFDIYYMKTLGAGVRQTLRYDEFAKSLLVSPPHEEQVAIAKYLDERTAIIDESIKTIAEQISAMKSLRQSLIHEAVTGKIDVADYGYHYA